MARRGGMGGRSRSRSRSSSRSSFRSSSRNVHYRRRHRYGSGSLSGLGTIIGALMAIFVFVFFFIFFCVGYFATLNNNESTVHNINENDFEHWTEDLYDLNFKATSNYEDYILVSLLIDEEDYYEYYYCVWIGDHVSNDVAELFGDEDSIIGQALDENIAYNYKYSLSSDLCDAIRYIYNEYDSNSSGLTCNDEQNSIRPSMLIDNTSLELDVDIVSASLFLLEMSTGVRMILNVSSISDFEKVYSSSRFDIDDFMPFIIFGAILLIFIIIIIVSTIKKVNKKKKSENNNSQVEEVQNRVIYSNSNHPYVDLIKLTGASLRNDDSKDNAEAASLSSNKKINDNDQFDIDDDSFKIDPNDY